MKNRNFYFGLGFIALLTIIVSWLANTQFAHQAKISALTIAILLGILIGNTFYPALSSKLDKGVLFAKGTLLRIGIILYGFRLTLQDISHVGINAIVTDSVMLLSTFFLAVGIGIYWLKMDKQTVYLTAGGCSICGAAAVMAMEPVTKAESHKVSVAVAVVVIFGTIAMFLYPFAYSYLQHWLTDHQFGIYIGSTVHEVAQVYAAGGNIGPTVADTAVITKMIRVMMLAPFLLVLSWALSKQKSDKSKINIPWFAFLFILMAIFNSFDILPKNAVKFIVKLDDLLLIAAMIALGLTTHISAIKKAGVKPLLLGMLLFIWLVLGGLAVNLLMQGFL